MGLTNWQLFFQNLEQSTQAQEDQDNEVLTVVRHLGDTSTLGDSAVVATSGSPVTTVGSAVVGFSQVA